MLLVLPVAIFYWATLRPGHVWGDDFAHYIMQGESIAQMRSVASPNYIVNPETIHLGPAVVPPGLSVALAPVIRLFGINLQAMKMYLVLFTAAGLMALYFLSRFYLPR